MVLAQRATFRTATVGRWAIETIPIARSYWRGDVECGNHCERDSRSQLEDF